MNRLLIAIISVLFFSTAFASSARVSSLQSNHLNDSEFIYLFPTKLLELQDYVILNTGSTNSTNPFQRPYVALKTSFEQSKSDNYVLGVTLGRSSDLADSARQAFNTAMITTYDYSQNPVNINYAVRNEGRSYSMGFFYANKKDKVAQTENAAGTMNLGLRVDDFTLGTIIGLFNTVDASATDHLSINQAFSGALVYELDDIHFILDVSSSRAKKTVSNTQTESFEFLDYKMGLVKNIFNGYEMFFYRINLETVQNKNRTLETTGRTVKLPLTLGFESDVTDIIKLRASIQQIVGVYQGEDFSPGQNTTTAAVGLGLQFNKIVIDGVLQGLVGSTATQAINSNEFLTQTSITYWF